MPPKKNATAKSAEALNSLNGSVRGRKTKATDEAISELESAAPVLAPNAKRARVEDTETVVKSLPKKELVEDTETVVKSSPLKAGVENSECSSEEKHTEEQRPASWNTKFISWNVNGIRAWLKKKDGIAYFRKENPDFILLQETKCGALDLPSEIKNFPDYHTYFQHTNDRDGYAGVGLLSKKKPLNVSFGLGIEKFDSEGRLITAEFDEFYLIGAYVPNSGRALLRLSYRQEWNATFLKYIKDLDSKKPIIYTGDLNCAHLEIDLKNPKSNVKNAGFTKEERKDFTELLNAGFVDTFRMFYPNETGKYTFWTYMANARAKNVGWRLDYFLVSDRWKNKIYDTQIHSQIMGSDHCPISLLMQI